LLVFGSRWRDEGCSDRSYGLLVSIAAVQHAFQGSDIAAAAPVVRTKAVGLLTDRVPLLLTGNRKAAGTEVGCRGAQNARKARHQRKVIGVTHVGVIGTCPNILESVH
jgi:hypothetical protein